MISRRTALQFVVVMLLVGLTAGLLERSGLSGPSTGTPTPSPDERDGVLGSAPTAPPPRAATQVVDPGFPYPADLATPPTAGKDQSKLWFHSTAWWAVMAGVDSTAFTIHRLNWSTRQWLDTGVIVEDRLTARADALWDGDHLFVASAGTSAAETEAIRLSRYSYVSATGLHELDPGFPVVLSERGVSSPTVSQDAVGGLWLSYIVDGQIWMRHSTDGGETWSAATALDEAGGSVVVHSFLAHGDEMALMWSDQAEGTVSFASHVAGSPPDTWSAPVTVVEGALFADDHITARSLDGPDGPTLFAMVKTSRDLQPDRDRDDPQVLLLEMLPGGEWRQYVVGRVRDRHTRPLLLIDEDRRALHIFLVAPFGSGAVYYKTTPADEITLAPGRGAPFMELAEHPEITSPTSTKQNVTRASGLVVLAADRATERYVTGALPLH